ncbi:PAS domain S-box protein [Pseudomonas sp. Pf153]|uniref:PAS domain-containing sensor histidine kinase n=1 Tax=Pseudomonas sp. Pf153 TaxID=1699309 RepID=UPI000B083016|nr:PAS domain S-box protein [Pseudomonas sp. Pf153]
MKHAQSTSNTMVLRIGAIALAALFFVVDTLTSLDVAIAVLYVVVILICLRLFSKCGVRIICLSCIFLTVAAFFVSHGLKLDSTAFVRCLVSLSAIVITSLLALQIKTTDDELREQVRLLAQTHDAIVVRDMDGRISTWSPGAEALYGWSREEALGRDCQALLHTQLPITQEELMSVLLAKGSWEGELTEQCRDGRTVIVTSRCTLAVSNDGTPISILATHNDITARKHAADALRRSEAFLAGAQRVSRTGSIGLTVPGGEMYWSAEALRIFEFEEGTHPALQCILNRTHPDDIEPIKAIISKAFEQVPYLKIEHRLVMPDGRIKHIHMNADLMKGHAGECEYVGAVMDVTAAKMAEEALHRAQTELAYATRLSALGELAASIAHEVNQPLAAVTTYAEAGLRWLDRDVPHISETRSAMEQILGQARRASEVIRRIRRMSRNVDHYRTTLDLREVLLESLELVRHETRRSKVRLEYHFDDALPAIHADRVQLQQVIINLMTNSVQAMRANRTRNRFIRMEASLQAADTIKILIQDSGPGICKSAMSKLFLPLFTTKIDGMGMGLSICRSIVEAHGGSIWADNTPDSGAVIYFTLPVARVIDKQTIHNI